MISRFQRFDEHVMNHQQQLAAVSIDGVCHLRHLGITS